MSNNNISKSEWRIMRVLWEEKYLTSGEITKRLNKLHSLSNTTVKTQISNLIKKGVISANKDNRYPLYYPLVSELDCIQDAIDDIILQFYGDNLNFASQHFEYYGVNDQKFINLLQIKTEELYDRVVTFFGMENNEKIKVCIHASQQKLLSAYGKTFGPDWMKTTDIWGIIHLAPLVDFKDDNPLRYFSYSLIMILISRINVSLPFYIKQGICVYLGSNFEKSTLKEKLQDIYLNFTFKDLINLHIGSDSFGEMNHLEIAYSFIDFIVEDYGKKALLDILYNRINFLNFVDNNKEEIIGKWKKHIKNSYLKGDV